VAKQAARRIPFTNIEEILDKEAVLKAYIQEAVEAEKAGSKSKYSTCFS
tara:strand:- start:2018 stop:2164 length:147 start_codon:yes stop_codon:yes gene_type:complete